MDKQPSQRGIIDKWMVGLLGNRHERKANEAFEALNPSQKSTYESAEKLKKKGYIVTPYEQYGSSVGHGAEHNAAGFAGARDILLERSEHNLDLIRQTINHEFGLPKDALPTPANVDRHTKLLYSKLENEQQPMKFSKVFRDDMEAALQDYSQFRTFRPGIDPAKNAEEMGKVLTDYLRAVKVRKVKGVEHYEMAPSDFVKLYQRVANQRRTLSKDGLTQEEAKVFSKVTESLDRFADQYTGKGVDEFRQARKIYGLQIRMGLGDGDVVNPTNGRPDPQALMENLTRNDNFGFAREHTNSPLYETLRQFQGLTDKGAVNIPGIGRQVSTSLYSTALRPFYEAVYKRKMNRYLLDPSWRSEYPAGATAMKTMVPGLLQGTQFDSPLYHILQQQYLNPDDEQPSQ